MSKYSRLKAWFAACHPDYTVTVRFRSTAYVAPRRKGMAFYEGEVSVTDTGERIGITGLLTLEDVFTAADVMVRHYEETTSLQSR